MSDIIVLAGGSTVADYNLRDLEQCGTLIAVNDAAVYTKPHVAVTMDRKWAEWRYPMLVTQGVPKIVMREGCNRNFDLAPNRDTMIFDHLDSTGMSTLKGHLNGSNSGTCALNYAFQQCPKRVFLLGFDMKRRNGLAYWYPSYPHAMGKGNEQGNTGNRTYHNWAEEFREIKKHFDMNGILVFNVTHDSDVNAFQKITYREFRERTS